METKQASRKPLATITNLQILKVDSEKVDVKTVSNFEKLEKINGVPAQKKHEIKVKPKEVTDPVKQGNAEEEEMMELTSMEELEGSIVESNEMEYQADILEWLKEAELPSWSSRI